jgi:hypothetical protein
MNIKIPKSWKKRRMRNIKKGVQRTPYGMEVWYGTIYTL